MSDVLAITRGADFAAAVDFDNADGTPIDLTGYAVTAVIAWPGGSLPLTIAVTDAATGKASFTLTETQTAQIPAGRVSELTVTYESAGGDRRLDRCFVEGV